MRTKQHRRLVETLEPRRLLAAHLIADINPTAGSDPAGYFKFDNVELFTATDGTHGRELWATDGTSAGTTMLADINPGAGDSSPTGFTVVGGAVYFSAFNGTSQQLWVSDGTPAGTRAVAAVAPANGYSDSSTAFNGDLYYIAATSNSSWGIYKSDGTPAGSTVAHSLTQPSGMIVPEILGIAGSKLIYVDFGSIYSLDAAGNSTTLYTGGQNGTGYETPNVHATVGGYVYFDNFYGGTLWRTDGTAAGTTQFAVIDGGLSTSLPAQFSFTPVNGSFYVSSDWNLGPEPAVINPDGTFTPLRDIYPGHSGSYPTDFTAYNGKVYFIAGYGDPSSFSPPTNLVRNQLWVTDGTANGTTLVYQDPANHSIDNLTAIGNYLYFEGNTASSTFTLFGSDGTVAGTTPLVATNPPRVGDEPIGTVNLGQPLVGVDDGTHGFEPTSFDFPTAANSGDVSGFVFTDETDNGPSSDDRPRANVRVWADVFANGIYDPGEPTALTSNSGSYTLTGVPIGPVTIRELQPLDKETGAGVAQTVTVSAAATPQVDFLNFGYGSESGAVYTGDVVTPPTQIYNGVGGVTVYLDLDHSGSLTAGDVVRQSTAINGAYNFFGLDAGTYTLGVVPPAGYTDPDGFQTFTITSGAGPQIDLHLVPPPEIGGNVFTTGNAPVPGVMVTATDGSTSYNLSTGSDGSYDFKNIPAGTYTLSIAVPTGYTLQTTTDPTTVTVPVYNGQVPFVRFLLAPLTTATVQLTGTPIGTSGSYKNGGNTIAKAFDGNLTTFFDGPGADGNTVGLDLGYTRTITRIAYAPRSSFAARMVGGTFQASSSADFTAGVVNLFTIASTPTTGSLTTETLNTPASARYVRYVSPVGSYGNIAELQLFGPGVVLTRRTGTVIGTTGSYQARGNTTAKAFDGNLSTFFDGPGANGNWAGLDLGAASTVAQIRFAPRAGYESRMVGGIFQASTSADFSTGVVNLYTVTSTPVSGSLTTVTLTSPVTYRYYRYLSPAGSYGNIAELAFYG